MRITVARDRLELLDCLHSISFSIAVLRTLDDPQTADDFLNSIREQVIEAGRVLRAGNGGGIEQPIGDLPLLPQVDGHWEPEPTRPKVGPS
jgi:hypothetical protein